jgi:murein L,D-transpeptidase YcbB/YkuD
LLLALALQMTGASAQDALLWFEQGRPTPQAIEAVDILNSADADGLVPADYDADPLRQAVLQAAQDPTQPPPADLARIDTALTAAMSRYLLDLHQGRLDPRDIHQNFRAPPLPVDFDPIPYLYVAVATQRLPEAVYLAAPRVIVYARLRRALADYRRLSGHPAWGADLPPLPGKKLEPGQPYDGLMMLAQRLIALGDLPVDAVTPDLYEGELVAGLQAFQRRHGLQPDGILGSATFTELQVPPARRVRQIELTLERLRWTPLLQAPRMITVNIPEFMLRAYEVKDG